MQTLEIILGAGDTAELGEGNFFQYLRGDDPIKVTFYHGTARLVRESADKARPGYQAMPPRRRPRGQGEGEAIGFTSCTIESDTAQTIEIGISEGEGGYNRFTGDTEIIGPLGPNGAVEVEDTAGNSFAELLALLKNAADQRAPLTTLAGATLASVEDASATAVSAGANVNGVIIRSASVTASVPGDANVQVGGTILLIATGARSAADSYAAGSAAEKSDIFVPAGEAVTINSSGVSAYAAIAYEVL